MRRIEYKKTTWRACYRKVLTGCSALLASVLLTLQAFAVTPPAEGLGRADAPFRGQAAGQEERMLIPGGTPFGVRVYTKGVMVIRVEENSVAEKCGILPGDLITKLNGQEFDGALDFSKKVAALEDGTAVLDVQRGDKKLQIRAEKKSDLKGCEGRDAGLGLYVRDTLAGIGTLTYFDPQKGTFAGLGHGICETHTGVLLPISQGTITDVRITSVNKGAVGAPGQLRGIFCPGVKGSVLYNKEEGLFGIFQKQMPYEGSPLPVAKKEQIKEGEALILCTVKGQTPEEYTVKIEKIYGYDRHTKNFLIKVTDDRLLEQAGGIVQGMSGSPIIQDGRIVGAVTHVLVDDPASGYGIYIGNMLDAAE